MSVTTSTPSFREAVPPMLGHPRTSPADPTSDGPPSDDGGGRSLRVLQLAFSCDPDKSMESRIGWLRAVHAARRHQVTVLHGPADDSQRLNDAVARAGLESRLRFVLVEPDAVGMRCLKSATWYWAGYRRWHSAAARKAHSLHEAQPVDLVHLTTLCGYREPGLAWKLDAPFVWGPIGGTQSFPVAYLNQLTPRTAWIELVRNAINAWQLRFSPRVRGAFRRSALVVAATEKAARDIAKTQRLRVPVRLETALDIPVQPPREPRDPSRPLRILWSGRLRAWKTLPLLLRALPLLPEDVNWRLRVLGVGSSGATWRRLAERLGVADRIEWLGWPGYRDTLPDYRWADVFAFTSMRDTSGTGLLESLAAGAPIVGVDHQGAADIMTRECSVPVPVTRPRDTVQSFAVALTRLAREGDLLRSLSEGARRRATEVTWEAQADDLLEWYDEAVARHAAAR